MSVAEPIAHAMSALHRIEASHGAAVGEAGPAALNAARQALATLQVSAGQHPAVDQALEAIAGSLSLIHGLAQAAPAPAVSPYAGTMVAPSAQAAPPPAPQMWQPQPGPAYQRPAPPPYPQPA
ncbi:MAG TPA: hypothetical protein VHV51_17320, partial [Polyangiaceae bacterium]|nr:hypothetical protein [Polyangiaceae bacterium]